MDWTTLYCPNRACAYYGQPWAQSRLVKNGMSHGTKQARCQVCHSSVSLSYGTAFYELQADPAWFALAVRALAEGNSLRATGRIVQIDKDTAAAWLDRAAQQCRRVMLYLWQDLHISECQLDELWSFVHTKEQNLASAVHAAATYGDAWIWIAFAPLWRLVVAFVVGPRTQEQADLLLRRVRQVSDPTIPFFTSDQFAEYPAALLAAYGEWVYPARNGRRGRHPKPRLVPPPELVYAQVVKQRERGRVVAVSRKLVFGADAALADALADSPASTTINTSFVERENLTLRQHNRRLTRKTNGFSKELSWLEKQLWLMLAYYHLVLPHGSLRRPLAEWAPTRGQGSARRWEGATPAMAAGLTDHIWSMEELLGYRVPATFLETLAELEHVFPPLDLVHHGT